jgi:hypothetical protein
MNRKEVLKQLDEQFSCSLNGEWKSFKESLADLRLDLDEMSEEDIKLLRKALNTKFNNRCNAIKNIAGWRSGYLTGLITQRW